LAAVNGSGWEQPLPPLARLILPLAHRPDFVPDAAVLYLRNAQGALLAEVRFTD
jgi:hypothetical protein